MKEYLMHIGNLVRLLCERQNLREEISYRRWKDDEWKENMEERLREIESQIKHQRAKIKEAEKEDIPPVRTIKKYGLDEKEKEIIWVMLFSNAYGRRSRAEHILSPSEIIPLIADTDDEILTLRKYFYENGKLRRNGIIIPYSDRGYTLDECDFVLSEKFLREFLGHEEDEEAYKIDNELKREFYSDLLYSKKKILIKSKGDVKNQLREIVLGYAGITDDEIKSRNIPEEKIEKLIDAVSAIILVKNSVNFTPDVVIEEK